MCQSLSPRELKIPSTDSEEEKIPAVVSLWLVGDANNFLYRRRRAARE